MCAGNQSDKRVKFLKRRDLRQDAGARVAPLRISGNRCIRSLNAGMLLRWLLLIALSVAALHSALGQDEAVRAEIDALLRRNDSLVAPALKDAYRRHDLQPFWTKDGRPGPQAIAMLDTLHHADRFGLRPQDYQPGAATVFSVTSNTAAQAQFDIQLSATAIRFVAHLRNGRVDPHAAGFHLPGRKPALNISATLATLSNASDVGAALASFEPDSPYYRALKVALARYRELATQSRLTHLPALPAAASKIRPLRIGDEYTGAPQLRTLLHALGDLPIRKTTPNSDVVIGSPPLLFDQSLSAAVSRFQARHGLTADGIVGERTFAALSTPLA